MYDIQINIELSCFNQSFWIMIRSFVRYFCDTSFYHKAWFLKGDTSEKLRRKRENTSGASLHCPTSADAMGFLGRQRGTRQKTDVFTSGLVIRIWLVSDGWLMILQYNVYIYMYIHLYIYIYMYVCIYIYIINLYIWSYTI